MTLKAFRSLFFFVPLCGNTTSSHIGASYHIISAPLKTMKYTFSGEMLDPFSTVPSVALYAPVWSEMVLGSKDLEQGRAPPWSCQIWRLHLVTVPVGCTDLMNYPSIPLGGSSVLMTIISTKGIQNGVQWMTSRFLLLKLDLRQTLFHHRGYH